MAAIILYCALAISPQDCDTTTARRFEHVPGTVAMPTMCLRNAEVWAAEHGLSAGPGEYAKTRCSRSEFGGRVG
jgi:hypothetical protein